MNLFIKQRLHEELTKTDKAEVEKIIDKAIKDAIKNDKTFEDEVVNITKNVLTQLYKTLWVKRSFWKSTLKNKKA